MVTPGDSVENIQLSEDQSNHKNCLFHVELDNINNTVLWWFKSVFGPSK